MGTLLHKMAPSREEALTGDLLPPIAPPVPPHRLGGAAHVTSRLCGRRASAAHADPAATAAGSGAARCSPAAARIVDIPSPARAATRPTRSDDSFPPAAARARPATRP